MLLHAGELVGRDVGPVDVVEDVVLVELVPDVVLGPPTISE